MFIAILFLLTAWLSSPLHGLLLYTLLDCELTLKFKTWGFESGVPDGLGILCGTYLSLSLYSVCTWTSSNYFVSTSFLVPAFHSSLLQQISIGQPMCLLLSIPFALFKDQHPLRTPPFSKQLLYLLYYYLLLQFYFQPSQCPVVSPPPQLTFSELLFAFNTSLNVSESQYTHPKKKNGNQLYLSALVGEINDTEHVNAL